MAGSESSTIGACAMVLAAGSGTRMRPLTDVRPKPLVEVAGKPLIDHAIGRLRRAGARRIAVNVHHKADMLERHLNAIDSPKIVVSDERDGLLETGGGVVKALPHLGSDPFFVMNADCLWIENAEPALERLRRTWNDASMDMLLLLSDAAASFGHSGVGDFPGDFHRAPDGALTRRGKGESAAFVFTGTCIAHPRVFKDAPQGGFSMNVLFDEAIRAGRLKGLPHDGAWLEVNTPEAIGIAERALAARSVDAMATERAR